VQLEQRELAQRQLSIADLHRAVQVRNSERAPLQEVRLYHEGRRAVLVVLKRGLADHHVNRVAPLQALLDLGQPPKGGG